MSMEHGAWGLEPERRFERAQERRLLARVREREAVRFEPEYLTRAEWERAQQCEPWPGNLKSETEGGAS